MTQKTFVREEVAKNNTEDSLWFIIDSKVYVTDFIDAHPGGEAVLKQGKASLSCCCYISFTTAEILGAIYKARSLRALLSKSHRFDELIRGNRLYRRLL